MISEDISSSLTGSLQRFKVTTSSAVAQNALTVGVNVYHGGTSGTDANNYFQVERAQLEIGEEATEFETLPFMETLRLCERYFYMTYPHGATIGAASGESFLGRFLDGTQSYGSLQVPNVNMRAAPTKVIYNLSLIHI